MFSAKRVMRSLVPVAAAAVVLAGALSACGDEAAPQAVPAPQAAISSATAASEPTAGQAPVVAKTQGWLQIYAGTAPAGTNAVHLNVISNSTVGQYVSDGTGRTLYRFDKDTAHPSASNCADQCATTWPPLTVARGQSLFTEGVDPQQVGFIERADGTCQVTVGGWPVYYFSKDQNPGDLLGQGIGGTWFAVDPNGAKALAQ